MHQAFLNQVLRIFEAQSSSSSLACHQVLDLLQFPWMEFSTRSECHVAPRASCNGGMTTKESMKDLDEKKLEDCFIPIWTIELSAIADR